MSLGEVPIAKAERIPFLVREAAKFVPVGDYLKIRFQNPISEKESAKLFLAAGAIPLWEESQEIEEKYQLTKEIEASGDFREIASRLILRSIPIDQYLAVRQEILAAAIEKNEKNIKRYRERAGLEGEGLDEFDWMRDNLSGHMDLTMAVAKTAGVTLP